MTLQRYIEQTKQTAVYPKQHAHSYLYFGLLDELGELQRKLEKAKAALIDVQHQSPISESDSQIPKHEFSSILDELGDVCWYLAQSVDVWGIDISTLRFDFEGVPIPSLEHAAFQTENCIEILRNTGTIKKYLRGDPGKKAEVKGMITDVYRRVGFVAGHLGIGSLSVVFEQNINKLTDRKDRGVIRGDGDTR